MMARRRKAARDDDASFRDLIREIHKRGMVEPLPGPLPPVLWLEEHDPGRDASVVITAEMAGYLLHVVRMNADFLAEHAPEGPEISWCICGRGLDEPICGAPAASLDQAKARAEAVWRVLVGAAPDA